VRNAELAAFRVVSPGTEMQIHPAGLHLHLVVILGRAGWQRLEQGCCVKDGVADADGGFLARALRGRLGCERLSVIVLSALEQERLAPQEHRLDGSGTARP
jgi:hypothetical protein